MEKWHPTYKTKCYSKHSKAPISVPYTIYDEDLELDECPVSYITQESIDIVRQTAQAERIKTVIGAFPITGELSGAQCDTLDVMRIQQIRENNARIDEESRDH